MKTNPFNSKCFLGIFLKSLLANWFEDSICCWEKKKKNTLVVMIHLTGDVLIFCFFFYIERIKVFIRVDYSNLY
jgi:hypothetical protein